MTEGINKICESCGKSFTCQANSKAECWCFAIEITRENREDLAKKYGDCICRDCLVVAGDKKIVS